MPAVSQQFSNIAAVVSAREYDESRANAPVNTVYKAVPKAPDTSVAMQAAIGFGIAQLTKAVSYETFQSTLAGGVQRLTLDGDRGTMEFNVITDPDGTLYERVPAPGACAFCTTMAAVAEVQREEYFEGYHNFCNCVLNPIFTGQSRTELPEYKQAREAYSLARDELEKNARAARREFDRRLEAEGKYSGGRKNTTAFRRANPDLSLTTENILRNVRRITGQK